ncbi:MAG: hypothetical protein R2708_25390 [Vicinamibacterales bacterium]
MLRKAVDDWKALGYRAKVGIELEAFVLQPDGKGGWTEWDHADRLCLQHRPGRGSVGLIDDIMRTAAACSLPVESINSECDTPQFSDPGLRRRAEGGRRHLPLFKVMARGKQRPARACC